jgi:signal transduction histidine kinase
MRLSEPQRSSLQQRLSVRDDVVGGAAPGGGSGLIGPNDRVEALGGRIHIASPDYQGTILTAEIPCAAT